MLPAPAASSARLPRSKASRLLRVSDPQEAQRLRSGPACTFSAFLLSLDPEERRSNFVTDEPCLLARRSIVMSPVLSYCLELYV